MKRLIIALLLLLLTVPALAAETHTVYMPVYGNQPFPPCERQSDIGIAWLAYADAEQTQIDLDNFCASMWFNTSAYDFNPVQPNEVPIIWCDTNGIGTNYYDVADTIPASYAGMVIMFNEPGTPGQCGLSDPIVAAAVYAQMMSHLPANVHVVSPNIIIQHQGTSVMGVGWLRLFLDEVERLGYKSTLDTIGIHFYGVVNIAPSTRLGWVLDMLAAEGWGNRQVCITEYGVHYNEGVPRHTMRDVTALLDHPKVSCIFPYTVRGQQFTIPFIELGPFGFVLTEAGLGLFDGYRDLGIVD